MPIKIFSTVWKVNPKISELEGKDELPPKSSCALACVGSAQNLAYSLLCQGPWFLPYCILLPIEDISLLQFVRQHSLQLYKDNWKAQIFIGLLPDFKISEERLQHCHIKLSVRWKELQRIWNPRAPSYLTLGTPMVQIKLNGSKPQKYPLLLSTDYIGRRFRDSCQIMTRLWSLLRDSIWLGKFFSFYLS